MSVKTSPPSRTRPRPAAEHPSGDPRFSLIDRTLKRFSFQQDALIEVLHTAQEAFGFLSDDLLIYVAHQLKLPLSWVYGVATFYHFFTLTPQGQHNCIVCMGTACYVKRAAEIVAALQQEFQVMAGEDDRRWPPQPEYGALSWLMRAGACAGARRRSAAARDAGGHA
jgi:bidirectional [NiFe] hydrogenase diaphorase subunit